MSSHPALIPGGGPLLVLAAHPDDEVIGVGARLAEWSRRVICCHATNGAPPDGRDALRAGLPAPSAYASARRREAECALAAAGISASRLVQLPFDDQSLAHRLPQLVTEVASVLEWIDPVAVVTHPYEGGHPDHDAVSLAVALAIARGRECGRRVPRWLEFACYHEGDDGTLVTNRFAPPRAADEQRLVLDDRQREAKRALMACFETQRSVLRQFSADEEGIRTAPAYDYRRPPNGGRVWYDRFDWNIDSATWLRHAAECLAAAGVPVPC